MTNNTNIIDGVDISGCEFCDWKGSDIPQCRIRQASFEPTCKGYNCYYKQLKHKEQKLDKIKTICEKETTKSTFCNGIENKDSQKLAIKILKIIIGGK